MRSSCFLVAMLLAGAVVAAAPGTVLAQSVPAGFTDSQFASGVSSPTAMQFAPDGRLFVCRQGGQLEVFDANGGYLGQFMNLNVNNSGERGLLGIAFDPNFANNNYLYVYYTVPSPLHNRVSRFTANGNSVVPNSEMAILDLEGLSATNHNGGAIHFGSDGMLYVAVGDNAVSSNSQRVSNRLGKILRISSNGTIPTDNPSSFMVWRNGGWLTESPAGVNRSIWAVGLRNPFTFAVQPGTGRMFINDVGAGSREEVNEASAGANYGWPETEGMFNQGTYPNFTLPRYAYAHGGSYPNGNCISGGAFYPSSGPFPATYHGKYFFGEYVTNWIASLDLSNNNVASFATGLSSPVDIKILNGALYYLARGSGQVRRISYTAAADQPTSVNFTNPTNGATLTGTVAVNAFANDPDGGANDGDGIQNVVFQLRQGTTVVATHTENIVTYDWSLDTTLYANGSYTLRATATSTAAAGGTTATANITVTISNSSTNQPPTATITAPSSGTTYNAGDTIGYAGTGTDPEDGTLGGSAFTWLVDFHHDTHTHPFVPSTSGSTSGSMTIPTTGETSANVWYRIYLTVTDSQGASDTVFLDVFPNTSVISLATSPSGLQVTLDGQPQSTPTSVTSVVGVERTLGANSPQNQGGTDYSIVSWSDGGNVVHTISTPASNSTYTATFGVDTDADGMADSIEGTYGLDPNDQDQDNNGQRDGLDDWDNNGVINQTQAANGTAPGSPGGGGAGPAGNGSKGACGALGLDALLLLLGVGALRRRFRRT